MSDTCQTPPTITSHPWPTSSGRRTLLSMASDNENPSIWVARIKKERAEIVAARLKKREESHKRKRSRRRGYTSEESDPSSVPQPRPQTGR